MENFSCLVQVVARECLNDLDVIFDKGKFKGSHRSRLERVGVDRWTEASGIRSWTMTMGVNDKLDLSSN